MTPKAIIRNLVAGCVLLGAVLLVLRAWPVRHKISPDVVASAAPSSQASIPSFAARASQTANATVQHRMNTVNAALPASKHASESAREISELSERDRDANPGSAKARRDERENEDSEAEEHEVKGMQKEPRPFYPDSAEGRSAVEGLAVNLSHGEWRDVGPINFGGKTYAVAVDSFNPKNVYAAYEVGGLWGTHDGGQSWTAMFNGFQDIAFSSVKTHPDVPGLVAAGLIAYGGGYFTSYNHDVGILLSFDDGRNWKKIGPTADATASVWEIGFGDKSGRIIYAPTDKGLYKTTDQGETWTKILAYTGSNFFNDRPSFAVDPENPNILLLADAVTGVMRSADAGKTWAEVDNWVQPTGQQNSTILSWSKANPGTVYAEAYTAGQSTTLTMYTSTDAGQTWTAGATTDEFQQGMYDMAIAADPFNAGHVIIHNTSLQSSEDGLNTLQNGNAPGPDCLAVTFDPSTPNVVYDGGDDGVFKSTDGGNTWSRFDVGVFSNKSIGGSLYAVGSDGHIYTNPADYAGQEYIPGYGWVRRSDGYEYNRYYVNPHDPTQLYDLGWSGDLYRSPNATNTKALIDPAPSEPASYNYLSLEFDPVAPNTLYFGKQELYKSTNAGNTWTQLAPATTFDSKGVYIIRVSPSNTKHIYVVSGDDQLWSSLDGGTTWTEGASGGGISMLAISSEDENTIYVAEGNGLYKSTDGGATLTQLTGFPNVAVNWVIVDPTNPALIYTALKNSGALVSEDSGATWQRLGQLLPLVQIDWMTVASGNLFAGSGASVWEMNLNGAPACRQVTVNPQSLTVPSSSGTYTFDISIPANCAWDVESNAHWVMVQRPENQGSKQVYVTIAGNTSGATRTSTLHIAGQSIPLTQLGGLDPAQNDETVSLVSSAGCVTIQSDGVNLGTSACAAGNTNQEFTLQQINGLQYRLTNSASGTMQCINVYNDAVQAGSEVAEYACGTPPGSNETFTLQPQPNGMWMLIGEDSRLCLSVGSSSAVQNLCNTSDATQLFTMTEVPPGFTLSVPPSGLSLVQGEASGTIPVTMTGVNFSGSVNLTVSGLPTGVTASFSPNPTNGTSNLTLTAASTAVLGSTTVTVTGTSGALTSSTTFPLTINSVASTKIQFVQVNANDTTTAYQSESTVTVPYTAAQNAGDLNIIAVGWEDATATVSSVTDSNGNVYQLAAPPVQNPSMPGTQAIYYASNIKGASANANTVTVVFNTAASYPDVRIVEYAGVTTLAGVAGAGGTTLTVDSGPATTTAAPLLLFGASNVENWTNAPGTSYTQRIQSAWGNVVEDEVVSVPGTYDATVVQTPAAPWIMQLVMFK